jgi:subtilisin family serine protease
MPVKIFSDAGSTNSAAIVRGILYATKAGARVTSNSWGGGAADQAILDAFKSSPALHIMAAGNSGTNNDTRPHYPSSYDLDNNIAVAATDRNDKLASFSCYGEKSVDLAAPGVEIYSTVPGGGYANKSGTSMATPHVTGAAGLLLAQDPTMSNDELKARLLGGADKKDSLAGKVATGGRLNINNALEMDYKKPAPPENPPA